MDNPTCQSASKIWQSSDEKIIGLIETIMTMLRNNLNVRPSVLILVGLSFSLFAFGCHRVAASQDIGQATNEPEAARTEVEVNSPARQSGEVVISGIFAKTFGDPPTGENGGARINYTLTTLGGEEWVLVFEENRYWPPNGVRRFHLRQVVARGSVTEDGRLLVESLELQ